MNTSSKYNRLDSRIVEVLSQGTPLSIQELSKCLGHKRPQSIGNALSALLLKGQVQRVGLTHRYRLSPTQSALYSEQSRLLDISLHINTHTM